MEHVAKEYYILKISKFGQQVQGNSTKHKLIFEENNNCNIKHMIQELYINMIIKMIVKLKGSSGCP